VLSPGEHINRLPSWAHPAVLEHLTKYAPLSKEKASASEEDQKADQESEVIVEKTSSSKARKRNRRNGHCLRVGGR
jgi:hypothetical protein